ncbi:polysaccharide lyase, putative [Phytophthora infestans T30-4]|uniref:Probable pectate lyase F n=1 Tax=Phytophthora infestans (strain T30-4) TaxID=403677 RepID=D0NYD3_PHYIT|nr:polysaccharide lyase, putative [Phytophthora infestans T30-4]EEY68045.1 polysaccharide lyase, putative [Phytophthora infestans T30-4]|eukprot:XP_002997603.1 polysaccharide lyase, putative [Phytophthora infestans T30-4]
MKTFERSDVSCEGQSESGADTAVFNVEAGGHLKNVIIGKNQMEGVHCDKHDCIIENVWWDDVCEDALSVKGGTASSVTKVIGGGARYADDKVIQHNGFGTVDIDGFYGEDISKLYRSCGTCGNRPKKVSVSNTYVLNPTNAIVTVNKNWGDQATLRNVWVKSSKPTVKVCQWSQGNANGEPKMLGHGPSNPLCKYSESDVHINEDISEAATTPSRQDTTASVPDGTWPASTGIVRYKKPYTIKAGEVFDGKMQTFERSDITCSGWRHSEERHHRQEPEGDVHCDYHDCTIESVWWDDVCEDALSIKGGSASSVTTVTNCGARFAEDKVVQHNGYGTVKIKDFFAQEFGKLYRSCGTCGNIPRKVTVENVYALDPLVSVVTVNKNNNDQATLKNIFVKTTDGKKNVKVCQWSQASKTPSNVGDGPSGKLCQYSTSDVHINED